MSPDQRVLIERSLIAEDERVTIADILDLDPQTLVFTPVISEEAEVWRVTLDAPLHIAELRPDLPRHHQALAWLKRHQSRAKARREAEALTTWGRCLNAPRALGWADARTLILAPCAGVALSALTSDTSTTSHAALEGVGILLGDAITTLHNVAYEDTDTMTLIDALRVRARRALNESERSTQELDLLQPDTLHALSRACDQLRRLLVDLDVSHTPLSSSAHILYERVPCHRDLRPHHLYFERGPEVSSERSTLKLSVIDWGQARPDTRIGEWARFYLGVSADHAELIPVWWEAWSRYCERCIPVSALDRARRQLTQLVALEAVNTLNWAGRHHVQVVCTRRLRELEALRALETLSA